jgi:hypothetical protein
LNGSDDSDEGDELLDSLAKKKQEHGNNQQQLHKNQQTKIVK